jgi:CRP-like cAMP-binding protein
MRNQSVRPHVSGTQLPCLLAIKSDPDELCAFRLAEADRQHLLARAERVLLPKGMVLLQPDQPPEYVYFASTGIASVVVVSRRQSSGNGSGWAGRIHSMSGVLESETLPF